MILCFPNLDTLKLALTGNIVPASASTKPARAGFDGAGQVWLESSAALPRPALAELRKLGVQTPRTSGVPLVEELPFGWIQTFPLQPTGERLAPPEQTPVLFDVAADQLPSLVAEMLRLGNDRQGFRFLQGPGAVRALLRVVGPPYYSLLRALDCDGHDAAPVAYAEAAPRLWVQFGQAHPLAGKIAVPEGKLLLLRPPRAWTLLDDAPFRDVYEVLEFPLPQAKSRWADAGPPARITVPLRLAAADAADAAELWVVRERPVAQLDELVAHADDRLLRQLAFAVAEQDGRTLVVLRVRPTKDAAPPALVLPGAVAFRSYLKLPNLFVPLGRRLHPPLRRDAVRSRLADDPAVLTWLQPLEDGTFRPESLPDAAFRPLSDWVDYVLDHERESLQAWVQSTRFDFEAFVCADEQPSGTRKPPASDREKRSKQPAADLDGLPSVPAPAAPAQPQPEAQADAFIEPRKAAPSALQRQLRALEEKFLALDGQPNDSPERLVLWPELARLNSALDHGDDAGLCWLNVLWADDPPPRDAAGDWCRAEALRAPSAGDDLDRVLGLDDPASADVRALAAYVFWASEQQQSPPALGPWLGAVRQFLERHERLLPVRAAWLAWLGVARLSSGDVLALARARDRLLERLYQQGLRPEQDMPNFLRFSGQPDSRRFRTVRHWLPILCESVRDWVRRNSGEGFPALECTQAYVDLTFAFGLARLGEAEPSRVLLERAAATVVGRRDPVHAVLLQAYRYRIEQALEGKAHQGPLPADGSRALEAFDQISRYVVERLLEYSRILDPDETINAFRKCQVFPPGVERVMNELPDIRDRAQLSDRIKDLLQEAAEPKVLEVRPRVFAAALKHAPRVGEEFAVEVLAHVNRKWSTLPDPKDPAGFKDLVGLLEKGLVVAAHFDQGEFIPPLVTRFRELLRSQHAAADRHGLDSLARQSFRGLRKLGLRDTISQLLQEMVDVVLEGRDLASLNENELEDRPVDLRTLLYIAAEWYFFGKSSLAEPVLRVARAVLFKPLRTENSPKKQGRNPVRERKALACAYAFTLGQAPGDLVQKGIEELFQKLEGVKDTFTTNSHYNLSQLEVAEAAVLAVVTDDFALGSGVRRWLDDDEFLVRRRLHRDFRAAQAHA